MTAGGRVDDMDLIGEGCDELVAVKGEFGDDTLLRDGESGEDQQTTGRQAHGPFWWHALG